MYTYIVLVHIFVILYDIIHFLSMLQLVKSKIVKKYIWRSRFYFILYIYTRTYLRFDIRATIFSLLSSYACILIARVHLTTLVARFQRILSWLHNSAPTKQLDKRSRKNRVRSRKTYSPRSHMWKLFADTAAVNKKRKKKEMLSIRIARLRSYSRSYYANVALARVCSRINNARSIPMSALFYAETACTAVLVSAIIRFNPIMYDFSKSLERKIRKPSACKFLKGRKILILLYINFSK